MDAPLQDDAVDSAANAPHGPSLQTRGNSRLGRCHGFRGGRLCSCASAGKPLRNERLVGLEWNGRAVDQELARVVGVEVECVLLRVLKGRDGHLHRAVSGRDVGLEWHRDG